LAKGILERLSDGIVLGDGGYIVELEKRGYVIAGAFTPELALAHPDAIREMHREFVNAGAEVIQVMAFYGSREKLATVGHADRTFEINQAATRIAKEVAGDSVLVAGDLSATWKWEADNPSARELVAGMFDEQIEAQANVDFFIGETFWHFGEAVLCLERIKAKTSLPAMITVSFRGSNVTDDGVSAAECAKRLSDAGAEIVGVN
jgi:betaine-homocysteine S-methyltransferase